MQTYYYGLWLLAFGVVLINSRFIPRSIENEQFGNEYYPNSYYGKRIHQPNDVDKLLNYLIALDLYGGKSDDGGILFERRRQAIEKGDPREFMG